MTSVSANIHVKAGDPIRASYRESSGVPPHIVAEFGADLRASLFLPADVATLDLLITQLDAARVAAAIAQGVAA